MLARDGSPPLERSVIQVAEGVRKRQIGPLTFWSTKYSRSVSSGLMSIAIYASVAGLPWHIVGRVGPASVHLSFSFLLGGKPRVP